MIKKLNKGQRKREKRATKKASAEGSVTEPVKPDESVASATPKETVSVDKVSVPFIGNEVDDEKIRQIFNYLNDDELKDRFVTQAHLKQDMVEINLGQNAS